MDHYESLIFLRVFLFNPFVVFRDNDIINIKMELQTPTAHEAFTLMLLERLEQLEDAHRDLKNQFGTFMERVGDHLPVEWVQILFKADITNVEGSLELMQIKDGWINQLFQHRSKFEPEFAYWSWWIDGEPAGENRQMDYYLKMYLRVQRPIAMARLREWVPEGTKMVAVQGGSAEVQRILQENFQYTIVFPPSCMADYGMDVWRRGGDTFEYPLEVAWVPGPFLSGPNYTHPVSVRFLYLNWFLQMVKNGKWSHLFRLEGNE
jgi:hypothetical protein